MDQSELETSIRRIDARTKRIEERMAAVEERTTSIEERTTRIEQTFFTKDDAKAFLTKDDAKPFLTKDDAREFATKDDVREEGERTRRHFDVVAEEMKASIAVLAEGYEATRVYVDRRLADTGTTLESHDKRILKLEAKSTNPGDKPKRRSTRRDG